jgi:hypothetical protein
LKIAGSFHILLAIAGVLSSRANARRLRNSPFYLPLRDNMVIMKRAFQLLILMIIIGSLLGFGFAKREAKGKDICNKEVMEYLKSVGFLPSGVDTICDRAKDYMKLNEGRISKYEALALQLQQMWAVNNPSKPIPQSIINHAVNLISPTVCNELVVRYLKSEGLLMSSIMGICNHAESLREDGNLTKSEAMRRALRDQSLIILKINDNLIKEAVRLINIDDSNK